MAFDMIHLIQCMVLVSYGKDVQDLRHMCLSALRAVCRDDGLRSYYEDLLMQSRALPSSSTIYRHRATLHMGWCRMLSKEADCWLMEPEGVTRWGTLDSSGQGDRELVYTGYVTVLNKDLPALFLNAVDLIRLGSSGEDNPAELPLAHKLSGALRVTPGTPVGVGSGFQSLPHKLHAVSHSSRLTSTS